MSEVELRLTANVDNATREVGKFRKEYADLVRQVEKPLRQVNAFRDLESSLESTQQQMRQARERVRELGTALAGVANPSREMQAGYKLAVDELRKLERAEFALTGQLARRREELNAAGVSTRNLAAEQARLAGELQRALQSGRADQAMQDARKALGVGAIQEAQQRLVSLREQYRLLAQDGSLSGKERAEAEATYRRSVSETLQRLRDLRAATSQSGTAAREASLATRQSAETAREAIARLTLERRAEAISARQAAIATAGTSLGVARYRQLQGEVARTRAQYDMLRRSGTLTARELAVAQATMTQRVRETREELRRLTGEQQRTRPGGLPGAGYLGGATLAFGGMAALRSITRISDAYAGMEARLKLVTAGQEDFNRVQEELSRIADKNQSPLESIVTLYTRVAPALQATGRTQGDILAVTEAVAASFRISGATAQEATNGVIQFAQALGAGALRGDEFNSVAEQAPRLMKALADGLGVPITALRKMAEEGELTASIVTDALISQGERLKEEMNTLPETVGGALTRLSNEWEKAVATADLAPLIDAIDALKERVSDPATAEGLGRLSSALVRIGSGLVGAAADFGDAGDAIAAWYASLTGNITELDRLENEIRAIKQSLDGNWSPGDLLVNLFYDEEDLLAQKAILEERRELQKAALQGMGVDEMQAAEEARKAREKADEEALAARRAYVSELGKIKETELEQVKKYLAEQVKEERKAQAELEKVGKKRLEIEKFYADAVSKLRSGGEAKPSYARAQDLQLEARQLLRKGDFDGARDAAREAVKVLQELAEAGENTYGFEGFINALERIELSANDLEKTQAEEKLAGIQANLKSLQEQADQLKDVELTVSLDEQAVEAVKQQLIKLAAEMKRELTLPVAPTVGSGSGSVPGFSGGGWTGPGGKYEPAGIVHRGEFVQPQSVMRQAGAREFMELFRRHGMRLFRGYADGGMVMPRALPRIPAIPPGLLQGAAAAPAGTPINLTIDGRSFGLQGMPDVAAELARFVRLQKLQAGKR